LKTKPKSVENWKIFAKFRLNVEKDPFMLISVLYSRFRSKQFNQIQTKLDCYSTLIQFLCLEAARFSSDRTNFPQWNKPLFNSL